MKKIRIVYFLMLCMLLSMFAFAQDSTVTGTGGNFSLPAWVITAGSIVLGVYEVFARFIPTTKNISVLGFIINLIQKILPNKSTEGKSHP
jgi:hypothetical protein